MAFRYVVVNVDATPDNWHSGKYFDNARVVHEWIAKGSTPEMIGDHRNTFGLAELQAVTIAVHKPNVVLRMVMPDNHSVSNVLEFEKKAKRSLAMAFEQAGIAYRRSVSPESA